MITAHPDDEDGGMLAYESRGQGARASLMSLTRGEGGQNVMSNDYFDALGEVRSQELLKAGRYYGVKQYFGRVADYGFSKTKEEALDKWGHERVLYDAVRVVRMTRPLIVTSVFVGGPTDGHGHHQIAGVMAQEVFNAAGDPNMFPDQIKAGLLPWKPLKVYEHMPFAMVSEKGMYDYATGRFVPVRFYDYVSKKWIEGMLSADVEIPSGDYDPLFGQSYAQVGRTGLSCQKTQNGGTDPLAAGEFNSVYHRFASITAVTGKEQSFFDGIDTSLLGIATLAKGSDDKFLKVGLTAIAADVAEATAKFNPNQTDLIAPHLARGLKLTRALIEQVQASNLPPQAKYDVAFELRVKEEQFNDALSRTLGISMLALVATEKDLTGPYAAWAGLPEGFSMAIPGQQFWVKVTVTGQNTSPVQIEKLNLKTWDGTTWDMEATGDSAVSLLKNKQNIRRFKVTVAKDAPYTRPYFSRPDLEQAWYNILDEKSLNLPASPYPLSADLEIIYEGVAVHVSQVVQSARHAVGAGAILDPLLVGPPIGVSMSPKAGIIPLSGSKLMMSVFLRNNVKGEAAGTVKLALPVGWTSTPAKSDFAFLKDGEEERFSFEVTPGKLEPKMYKVTALAEYKGQKLDQGYTLTGYEGLRRYPLYSSATYQASGVDVKVAEGLRVGYVMGTGDDVSRSLEEIGVHVQFLSPQDVASGDLSKYDSIVLGVRAYAARPELITNNGRLLNYVKNGGVLLVQYNTGQFDHNFGPYPYTLTSDPEKVVDETARVTLLMPDHPLLTWPNKITSADFDGWVEERGHSFMKQWDTHYEALTETHDPEQDLQKGGLLYARYGKGAYVYGAYALYRQLPEGVPGAFRLFANLISLSHNPQVQRPVAIAE